jgi:hypothetical protein
MEGLGVSCLRVRDFKLLSHLFAEYSLKSLPTGYKYTGAYGNADADLCYCNTVAYSLFSACGACQGQEWVVCGHYVFLILDGLFTYF